MMFKVAAVAVGRSTLVVNSTVKGQAAGAEVLAAASAALSASFLALTQTQPAFAATALSLARVLYEEARSMQPAANMSFAELVSYTASMNSTVTWAADDVDVVCPQQFGSTSVLDDMAYAAGWLAKATGEVVSAQPSPYR
jgi:hypothetical protein